MHSDAINRTIAWFAFTEAGGNIDSLGMFYDEEGRCLDEGRRFLLMRAWPEFSSTREELVKLIHEKFCMLVLDLKVPLLKFETRWRPMPT